MKDTPTKVYTIQDEKYGVQLVCTTKEVTDAHLATGKYYISGYGSAVTEMEVEDRITMETITVPRRIDFTLLKECAKMKDSETHLIVVLNDGETYSTIEGCRVMSITEKGLKKLDEGYNPSNFDPEDVAQWWWSDRDSNSILSGNPT